MVSPEERTIEDVLKLVPHFGRQPFAMASVNGDEVGVNRFLDMVYCVARHQGQGSIPVGVVSKNYRLVDRHQVLRTIQDALLDNNVKMEDVRTAVRHLEGHDCPASCYRCLRSYRNQRVHGILNWRLAMPYLQAAAASELEPLVPTAPLSSGEGPEWDEAHYEGCESPLELQLLQAIRAAGLPEPLKQHEVYDARGRLLTRADFAYVTPKRILIYADGLEFHSAIWQRIHDTRQSNQLQTEGWQVLRFLGPQVHRNDADCARQLRDALAP